MKEATVTDLPSGYARALRERRLQRKERGGPGSAYCLHGSYWLDMEQRLIQCRKCERFVDAFDVLLALSRDEDWLLFARDEQLKLRREKHDLEREIKNLKAQKRRSGHG